MTTSLAETFDNLRTALNFIAEYKQRLPNADKDELQRAYTTQFHPRRVRSVLIGTGYSLRFSEVRAGSFSNTVLSLSALLAYDSQPFVVVVVRPSRVDFLLSNSTFLRKISHSSLALRADNIKGSFNGTDILTSYNGTENSPEHFESLFALHSAFTWAENLERLVEATNAIVARDNRFLPTAAQQETILLAPSRAISIFSSPEIAAIEGELRDVVLARRAAIVEAAAVENVNIRGNLIEQLISGGLNAHRLDDVTYTLPGGVLHIDIKTKLLDRASAPKAYNVDKMLRLLSQPDASFGFFLVGIDSQVPDIRTRLVSIFERAILDATAIQHHWAGRSSRGVTQLSGRFSNLFSPDYQSHIDTEAATSFLKHLLSL